ncbi:MAG: lipoate--protein ligase family protein [Anaerolineaceae bacterium]|nr:lipoate--protein ligase family protein [Anaerolineaceae bacterium]NTV36159.1 lipoate--protein ligase family protein [Anaerolineaceae bacterium]
MIASKQNWRLILSPPHNGATNMAIDEVLLNNCQNPGTLPVLRFYSWDPPCLSLGRSQSIDDVNIDRLAKYQWGLVRRPTGGKGILHIDELTYSVIANADHPIMAGGVLPSYQRISSVFLYALTKLGLKAESKELASPAVPSLNGPVCFETPSNYEIVCNGKKLIGSAQARKGNGVLQHGTIPLFGDISRIVTVLKFQDSDTLAAARNKVCSRATTIQDSFGEEIPAETIIGAILEGFVKLFDISFSESILSNNEAQASTALAEKKYLDQAWNTRI